MTETTFALQTYLNQQNQKTLLRFITCGSVDDGKSTLIGRLLFETKHLLDDQLAALTIESKRYGTQQGALDFALLVDGLSAEREQGITIDVAYRFFDTARKKYVAIDTPGHEQYVRNMVTGASTADVAIVLIDAQNGIQEQTKRHSYLLSLVGIKSVIIAINKMDMVDYSPSVYNLIMDDYLTFSEQLNFKQIYGIPISALNGDNLIQPSQHMPWYQGKSLLNQLDAIDVEQDKRSQPFRMPIQWVNRPSPHFRGFSGRVVSGTISPGEKIKILPSGIESYVKTVHLFDKQLSHAVEGQSITLTLVDEIDISRGDMLTAKHATINISDQFQAHVVWMAEQPLVSGRHYWLKCREQCVKASVTRIRHQVNIQSLEPMPTQSLPLNGIGLCNIKVQNPIIFESYENNRELGSFILIDRVSHNTVGAGMINFALQRAGNLHHNPTLLTNTDRASIKHQTPKVYWLTGISGAGKSTIANLFEKKLFEKGHHTVLLDGDELRQGLCSDLGFTMADRVENVRRVAETARLMVNAGLIVIVALISPFSADRAFARSLFTTGEFVEIFVEASLKKAQQRDAKGLYAKAAKAQLSNFTAIDSSYESPEHAEITINTEYQNVDECIEFILDWIEKQNKN